MSVSIKTLYHAEQHHGHYQLYQQLHHTQQDNERRQVTRHSQKRHLTVNTAKLCQIRDQKLYVKGCPYLEVQLLNWGIRGSSGTRADESQVYGIYKCIYL